MGQFDQKQVRFLKPFNVIDFLAESSPADETRPGGRSEVPTRARPLRPLAFPTDQNSLEDLRSHFERVLGVIAAFFREYVLFCGAVFDDLLDRGDLNINRDPHHVTRHSSQVT